MHLLSEQPLATAPFQCCECFGCRGSVAAVISFPDYFNRSTGLDQNEECHHGTSSSHIKTSTLKRGGVDGKHPGEATDKDSGLLWPDPERPNSMPSCHCGPFAASGAIGTPAPQATCARSAWPRSASSSASSRRRACSVSNFASCRRSASSASSPHPPGAQPTPRPAVRPPGAQPEQERGNASAQT